MLTVRPDHYDEFHCIADKCRHSCCKGWEIDIDDESLQRFLSADGQFGEKLKRSIETLPSAHFILGEDESCPFLRKDGLCEMIQTLGESALCEICAEHPRFYNCYPGRLEKGLGACCEEAARLIREGSESIRLLYENDAPSEPDTPSVIALRDKLFSLLSDASLSFSDRLRTAGRLFGQEFGGFDASAAAAFYGTLERMDDQWTEMLNTLESFRVENEFYLSLDNICYERIAEYFLFRHSADAYDAEDAAARFVFAILSTEIICALDISGYSADSLRLYSAEIEYSDENVELILEAVKCGKLKI